MVCGLTDDELFVLYILYSHRNFRADAGYNSKKLQRNYSKKYDRDFGAGTKRLKNRRYITSIKKKDEKFYISDFKKFENWGMVRSRTSGQAILYSINDDSLLVKSIAQLNNVIIETMLGTEKLYEIREYLERKDPAADRQDP
jgi:hypothetical protein